MKQKPFVSFLLLAVLMGPFTSLANTTNVMLDLGKLVFQIQQKLEKGQRSEADLAGDIKEFDALLEKHKAEKPDDVVRVLIWKAKLYLEVLDTPEKAIPVVEQIKRDFPETAQARNADDFIEYIHELIAQKKRVEEAQRIQLTLHEGAKFPDFEEQDLAGLPLSTANYRGKVLLLDFWATFCINCIQDLPFVLKAYAEYHPKGLEVIGINLDEDKAKVASFIKQKGIPWPQYFDGQGWTNKLVTKYGVLRLPTTYLLDAEGKIIGRDLRGPALDQAIAKALRPN